MRALVALGAGLLLALTACDADAGSDADVGSSATDGPVGEVVHDGVYEGGVDIVPGVYVATRPLPTCLGYTAKDRHFSIGSDAHPDAYLASAALVGDVRRIVVRRGEFSTSMGCPRWNRESDRTPHTPDPATVAGACTILAGPDDLVGHVVAYLEQPTAQQNRGVAADLQERLMAVVEARTDRLMEPAGEMVDYLDDPSAWVTADGSVDPRVSDMVQRVRRTCST